MVFTRWNEGLYCILPADGPHDAVDPRIYLDGQPPIRVFHFRLKICNLLYVLVGEVFVVVSKLRQARRVEQELCKVAHRVNPGSELVSLYSTLATTHCQQHWLSSCKALFARLAQLTNACHRGKGVLVPKSATVLSAPTVHKWSMSAYEIATLVLAFPRLIYTWQANEWQVWTDCHLASQVVI